MEEVIKIDKEGLGIFSVPVPKDEFPEYYELVKTPMDYGKLLFSEIHLISQIIQQEGLRSTPY